MESLRLRSNSPKETQLLGNYLGELARKADIFLLTGELGAGKTCLVQGIARGLDVKEYAFSPSFVILREYHGRLPLYHIDLYRLDDVEEVADLGLEDYLYGDGVCVVEWAEKGFQVLPEDYLLIDIQYIRGSLTGRSLCLNPRGARYADVIRRLRRREGIVALTTKCSTVR
jgi:tRNA threonylcarbamoyladenosine biosynthesis protein TsaE